MPRITPPPTELPRGVSYDLAGLTVRKAPTQAEVLSNLLFLGLTVASVVAYLSLGFPEVVRGLPDFMRSFIVDVLANFLMFGPLAVPFSLYLAWRFATQPVLRLTQHAITVGPRWAWWRPTLRFQLGSVTIRGEREHWEEHTQRAVLCLQQGEKTAKLPLEPIVENSPRTGAAKLDWLVRELETAQAAHGESGAAKQQATKALAALRGRGRQKDESAP